MDNNNSTSFIVVAGIIILCVFAYVTAYNLLPNNKESNSYYVKVENEINAKVETIIINDGKLNITTSGNATEYCVKPTKSKPESNNLCWKKIENNEASISVYKGQNYYAWIKDNNGNISNSISINQNNDKK